MDVSAFQLLNLINNKVPFLLIDMRRNSLVKKDSEVVQTMLKGRVFIKFSEIESYFKNNSVDKTQPLILIHNWSWRAKQKVKKLEATGYLNACYLVGGVSALEQAARESSR